MFIRFASASRILFISPSWIPADPLSRSSEAFAVCWADRLLRSRILAGILRCVALALLPVLAAFLWRLRSLRRRRIVFPVLLSRRRPRLRRSRDIRFDRLQPLFVRNFQIFRSQPQLFQLLVPTFLNRRLLRRCMHRRRRKRTQIDPRQRRREIHRVQNPVSQPQQSPRSHRQCCARIAVLRKLHRHRALHVLDPKALFRLRFTIESTSGAFPDSRKYTSVESRSSSPSRASTVCASAYRDSRFLRAR